MYSFFFSSRRLHTRSLCDWSSDVCSSDLRPYADPVPPSAAISNLYKWRGVFFDAGLVEQFIRFVGIFPVGSLVELNSGDRKSTRLNSSHTVISYAVFCLKKKKKKISKTTV